MNLIRINQSNGHAIYLRADSVAMVGPIFEHVAPKVAGAPPIQKVVEGVTGVVIAGAGPQIIHAAQADVMAALGIRP